MAKPTELASRFKAAIERQEEEAKRAAADEEAAKEAERRRGAAAVEARKALFDDLRAFAEGVGIEVAGRGAKLALTRGERKVSFAAAEGRVEVEGLPGPAALEWADGAWTLRVGERALPFLDEGLEEIAVEGLGLPRPEPEPAAEPIRAEPAPVAPAEEASPPSPPAPPALPGLATTRPPAPKREEVVAPTVSRKEKVSIGSNLRELRKPWE